MESEAVKNVEAGNLDLNTVGVVVGSTERSDYVNSWGHVHGHGRETGELRLESSEEVT